MNSVDIVLAVLIGYAAYRGYSKGLIGTLASLVAPVAGVVAASRWGADGQELIAQYLQAPTFLLKILAWPMVFLGTVAAIRLAAGLATMALGIGNSLPSRVVAAFASASAVGVACGLAIVLLQSFVPPDGAPDAAPDALGQGESAKPGDDILSARAHGALARMDERVNQSVLGPPAAGAARVFLSTVFKPEAGEPADAVDDADPAPDLEGAAL